MWKFEWKFGWCNGGWHANGVDFQVQSGRRLIFREVHNPPGILRTVVDAHLYQVRSHPLDLWHLPSIFVLLADNWCCKVWLLVKKNWSTSFRIQYMSLWYASNVVIHIHHDMELGEVYQIYFSKYGRHITCKNCPNSVITCGEAPSFLHWWTLTGLDDIASSLFWENVKCVKVKYVKEKGPSTKPIQKVKENVQ